VDATPIPDTILFVALIYRVNVADVMQFWTSDMLKSAKHRVLVPKKLDILWFISLLLILKRLGLPFMSLILHRF